MLVCGENLYDFIGGKCQVDGFVESPLDIARNKKVYKDWYLFGDEIHLSAMGHRAVANAIFHK